MEARSDPTSDYSSVTPRPQHKWTVSQHITLAFLVRSYVNPWRDITDIFNAYFASELRKPKGLSLAALSAMSYDMHRGITGKDAVELLRKTAFCFNREPTLVDQDSIKQIATRLGIYLDKRSPGALSPGTQPPRQQRRAKRKAVGIDEDTDFLSQGESTPQTPKKRQRFKAIPQTPDCHSQLGARNGLLTPPATVSRHPVLTPKRLPAIINQPWPPTPKRLPLVAYRAFSTRSQGSYSREQGFCAGAFVDSDIPLPPNPQSQEYIDEAKRHVAPIPTGPTPFISTTTSVVRAIHRALQLGPDASICVLSLELADTEGRVQSACALKLRQLVNHYYVPFNEFLIYGKIDPSALLSIMPISRLLAAIPSIPSDPDPFKILTLRDSKSLRPARIAHERASLPLSYALGYAVGALARCLGIPYVQPVWEYAVTNLVVDFKFGRGLNRWSEWDDLNEIFQNAVTQSYQQQGRATMTEPEGTKGTTIVRSIKEEETSDSGRLGHEGAGKIPYDDRSTDDDEISICERMPDIWQYANTRDPEVSTLGEEVIPEESPNNAHPFHNLAIPDSSGLGPSNQLMPGERSTRDDILPEESSGIGAVRYASPLNTFRVHNAINGQFTLRPRMVDTLHIQPPGQLPPSYQQRNGHAKRGEYKYSWTGM